MRPRCLGTGRSLAAALALLLALLATGCSGVGLAYRQLDWTVPVYVETYMPLEPAQRQELRSHLRALLEWHCAAHLDDYAAWLREMAADIRAGRTTAADLERRYATLTGFWGELMEQAAPRLAELLHSTSPAQARSLARRLAADNADFRAEYVAADATRAREAIADGMQTRLERWLGRLQEGQTARVSAWAEQTRAWQAERLAARERWQQALTDLLAEEPGPEEFRQRITTLLGEPDRLWSEAYRARFQRARQEVFELLAAVLADMGPVQREHLLERLQGWSTDLERLACARRGSA
jgi:hypothetical protein